MAIQDCPVDQVAQVSPVSLVSLDHQDQRVNLDSQGSDSQDHQELKDSQVFPASQEAQEDQADLEWTASPASLDSLDLKVNLALDSMVLQVYQEYPEVKEYLDQREILVSLVALDHQDDLDLMVAQDLKVTLVYLVSLELVAHLDPPLLVQLGPQASLDHQAQWVHQVSQDQMERRETLALQV